MQKTVISTAGRCGCTVAFHIVKQVKKDGGLCSFFSFFTGLIVSQNNLPHCAHKKTNLNMAVSHQNKKRKVTTKIPLTLQRKRKAESPPPQIGCTVCRISGDGGGSSCIEEQEANDTERVKQWSEENFCFEVNSPEGHWCCIECGNTRFPGNIVEIMDKLFIETKIKDILCDLTQKHIRLGCSAGETITSKVLSSCKDYQNYSQKFILSEIFKNY